MGNAGPAIRRAREERGLSLREVAEAAPCGLGYLSRLERGLVAYPGPLVLARVARAVDPDEGGALYRGWCRLAGYMS